MSENTKVNIEKQQRRFSIFFITYTWLATVGCPISKRKWLIFSIQYRGPSWNKALVASILPSENGLPPLFDLSWWEQKHLLHLTHAREISDLQFSLVIFNCNECHCIVIRPILSVLFIYSFIQFPMIRSKTLHTHARTHTHTHTHIYIYICVCFGVCMYVYVCVLEAFVM